MRIAHFSDPIWAKGGIATYVKMVAAEQQASGHDVFFVDYEHNRLVNTDGPDPIYIRSSRDLCSTAREQNFDVIHLHCHLDWDSSVAQEIKQDPGKNASVFIRTVHNHDPYCPSGTRLLTNRHVACDRSYNAPRCLWGHLIDHCGSVRPNKIRDNFRRVTSNLQQIPYMHTITVSDYLRQQMIRSGYDGDAVQSLMLPAHTNKQCTVPPAEGEPQFVFMGRLTPQKGVDWLLKSISQSKSAFHVHIAGEGREHDALVALSKKLGVTNRVTFHGWLKSTDTYPLLMQSRALVFPSLWPEPAGFISLEAGTFSRAVVGSRLGAIPEYIDDGVTGLLVDPNNVGQLAASLDFLATNYDQAMEMGSHGWERIQKHHSLRTHCEKLELIYRSALSC